MKVTGNNLGRRADGQKSGNLPFSIKTSILGTRMTEMPKLLPSPKERETIWTIPAKGGE